MAETKWTKQNAPELLQGGVDLGRYQHLLQPMVLRHQASLFHVPNGFAY